MTLLLNAPQAWELARAHFSPQYLSSDGELRGNRTLLPSNGACGPNAGAPQQF